MFDHPAAMEITAERMLGNDDIIEYTKPAVSEADGLVCTPDVAFRARESCLSGSAESLADRDIEVTLENESVWSRFHSLGTEMILTKQGRRMFPCCRFRLSGLDPDLRYFLIMDIAPLDDFRHRWNGQTWEPDGPGEDHLQSLVCFHHDSPALGQHWMDGPVSFYTVKLTHDSRERDGVFLRPMHRYQPRLYVAPVSACMERAVPLKSPNVRMFTFPKTEFYAVTSYQNPQITRLKIDCNPFMLAFRKDESSARLIQNKLRLAPSQTPESSHTADNKTLPDGEEHFSSSSTHAPHQACESSAAEEHPSDPDTPLSRALSVTDEALAAVESESALHVMTLGSSESSEPAGPHGTRARISRWTSGKTEVPRRFPPLSAACHVKRVLRRPRPMKRGKKAKAKWWTRVKNMQAALVHRKRASVITAFPDMPMQPDLEDVEGVLFVSFTAKEALDVHVGNMRRSVESSSSSLTQDHEQMSVCVTESPVSEADRISEQELVLLQELKELKNRQVLHPELHKVGMKLSLLDPAAAIDLQYLGVDLPLPQEHTPSSSAPSMSCSSKTSDLTRFKSWMEKFSSKSTPSAATGSVNHSAFSSDMLDEYLESEGQRISERAAVFSASSPSPVVYQLPVRSSSYVRTLDSVLQMRTLPPNNPPSRRAAKRPPVRYSPVRGSSRFSHNHQPTSSSSGVTRVHSSSSSSGVTRVHSSSSSSGVTRVHSSSSSSGVTRVHSSSSSSGVTRVHSSSSSSGVTRVHPAASISGVTKVQSKRGRKRRRPQLRFNREAVDGAQSSCTKKHTELLNLEEQAVNHGEKATFISTERARFTLRALLTAEKTVETPLVSVPSADEDVCVKDFCRLGCVCDSLNREMRGSTHCGRVQCMFSCGCFKHKILLIHSPETSQSVRSLKAFHPESEDRPAPALRVTRLWRKSPDESDPEPLYTPKPAGALIPALRLHTYTPTPRGRPHANRPAAAQVQMVEKDPVYLYLESMMTCARVREYNSNPPPQVHLLPAKKSLPGADEALSDASLLKPSQSQPTSQSPDKAAGPEPTKLLEIISGCNWEAQRSLVLKELFRSINMDLLSSVFYVDKYKVELLSEDRKQDERRSIITYKVRVSLQDKLETSQITRKQVEAPRCRKPQRASKRNDKKLENTHTPDEQQIKRFPLLSGVISAGHLKANKRTLEQPSPIQVNGKTYAQAKLILGRLGSLHPANRLAAYVTGRIKAVLPNATQGRFISKTLAGRTRCSNSASGIKHTVTQANQSKDVFKTPPVLPGGIRFHTSMTSLKPRCGLSAADRVVPVSALPPGQQVVLQPVAGLTGVNMCQFNGQMIQLVPMQMQTSPGHNTGTAQQDPRTAAPLPQTTALPFVVPKIHSVPGRSTFTFGSAAGHGVQNSLLSKTGTFSFRICPPTTDSKSASLEPTGTAQESVTASTLLLPGGYRLIKLVNPAAAASHATNQSTESPSTENPPEEAIRAQPCVSVKAEPTDAPSEHHDRTAVHIKIEPDDESSDRSQNPLNSAGEVDSSQIIRVKIEDSEASESSQCDQSPEEESVRVGGFSFEGLSPSISALSKLRYSIPSPPAHTDTDDSVQKSLDWLWRPRTDGDPAASRVLVYCSDGWSTEDSTEQQSEDEVDIETLKESEEMIGHLRAKARRKTQKTAQLRSLVNVSGGGAHHVVRLMSDLPLYMRTRRLNQPLRERRRLLDFEQSLQSLRRTLCVEEDQSLSAEELLHQAYQVIVALEEHSRSLIAEKRALIRQHSHYQTLISISQHSAAGSEQETAAPPSPRGPATALTPPTGVNRALRLPSIVLQSFSSTRPVV